MDFADVFLLIMLISSVGAFIYFFSALINVFRKNQSPKTDFKRTLFFLGLAITCFILFGVSF